MADAVILLDTSALMFHVYTPARLSTVARRAIAGASPDQIVVSAITFWEIGVKVRRGRFDLRMSVEAFEQRVRERLGVLVVPVTAPIAMRTALLDWDHRDPADRMIVATAELHGVPVVTSDRAIREFYSATIW
jgi:PIN domain nuclease of toxin-antitoxin system